MALTMLCRTVGISGRTHAGWPPAGPLVKGRRDPLSARPPQLFPPNRRGPESEGGSENRMALIIMWHRRARVPGAPGERLPKWPDEIQWEGRSPISAGARRRSRSSGRSLSQWHFCSVWPALAPAAAAAGRRTQRFLRPSGARELKLSYGPPVTQLNGSLASPARRNLCDSAD